MRPHGAGSEESGAPRAHAAGQYCSADGRTDPPPRDHRWDQGDTVALVPGGLTGIRSLEPLVSGFSRRGYRVVALEPSANELGGAGAVGAADYDADIERGEPPPDDRRG